MSEEDAFLSAIEANLDDSLPRLVFADWLDEHGRFEEGAAWRATADKKPSHLKGQSSGKRVWVWFAEDAFADAAIQWARQDGSNRLPRSYGLFMPGQRRNNYPTARTALLDLIAAWVKVEREKEKCGACGGSGHQPWACKVCGATPQAGGEVSHGRGCYRIDPDGGGSEWPELRPCPACSGKAVAANA